MCQDLRQTLFRISPSAILLYRLPLTDTTSPSALIFIYEAVSFTFRKYGLPYGLSVSRCTLHLMVTHFDATLGMGGWLDLTQQGLSPCKKYKTSWRSSAKRYRIIDLAPLSYLSNLKVKYQLYKKMRCISFIFIKHQITLAIFDVIFPILIITLVQSHPLKVFHQFL